MKLIFSLIPTLLGALFLYAQPSSICERHYLNQLNRLRTGVLIVELPANPNQTAGIVDTRSAVGQKELIEQREARAMFEAFSEEFEFAEVVFRYPDSNGVQVVIGPSGDLIELENLNRVTRPRIHCFPRDPRNSGLQCKPKPGWTGCYLEWGPAAEAKPSNNKHFHDVQKPNGTTRHTTTKKKIYIHNKY